MKNILSSLDIISIVRELNEIIGGGKIQKIYQVGDEILFHIYSNHQKHVLRIILGKLIHLTKYVKENPQVPTNFCMYLRKYFKGGIIKEITQPRLERIVKIKIKKEVERNIIFELFGQGNAIVVENGIIKNCIKFQRFSFREIKPGVEYSLPPSNYDLSNLDFLEFKRIIKQSEKEIVRCLAREIGTGGPIAEEICYLSNVEKTKTSSQLSDEEIKSCFENFSELIKKVKYGDIMPRIIFKDEKPIDVIPFPLKIYENYKFKEFNTFNEALDEYYMISEKEKINEIKKSMYEKEREKIIKKINEFKNYKEELIKKSKELKETALEIKNNLYLIEQIFETIKKARENYSWEEIVKLINEDKERGTYQALLIKEINPYENKIVFDIGDGIEMQINDDPREVMNKLFEKSKKLESKLEGVEEAIRREEEKLNNLKVEVKVNKLKKINLTGKEWYEKFRWFRTSEGYLVIAGRNAQQNEQVMKYTEINDLIFHADIHGSPFAVLKNGRDAGEVSINEAAKFTAAYSKAWEKTIGIDVYYVLPYQVSKSAPSGEYLATGGFMIRGKKNFIKSIKPEICIGVEEIGEFNYKLISGPCSAVKKHAKVFVRIEPGELDENTTVKKLISFFKEKGYNFDYETVKSFLPKGGYRIFY